MGCCKTHAWWKSLLLCTISYNLQHDGAFPLDPLPRHVLPGLKQQHKCKCKCKSECDDYIFEYIGHKYLFIHSFISIRSIHIFITHHWFLFVFSTFIIFNFYCPPLIFVAHHWCQVFLIFICYRWCQAFLFLLATVDLRLADCPAMSVFIDRAHFLCLQSPMRKKSNTFLGSKNLRR